ncbi:MAG: hypothetical protein P4L42_14210 [Desulfocapsaceae bacterium]|nr:hypothetical protein [Desulfocapsaceae bacterium]
MKVKAAPGLKCPMEGRPRSYITDDSEGVDVPDTAYYRRMIADGSLEEAAGQPKASGSAQETAATTPKDKGGDR